MIANQTPFYGESGGQMGDAGEVIASAGKMSVLDCQKKLGDLIVHSGKVHEGEIKVGDFVTLLVDGTRRSTLRAHHSATHLLHEALRRALGTHVNQKGSLVAPDKLRFDISHPKALTPAEIRVVEDDVNSRVRANLAVDTTLMTPDDAIAAGAMRCSARNTARKCASSRWEKARTSSRSNCAAAPMCAAPAISA